MKLGRDTTPHLTYCLNVHAGETWEENFKSLGGPVLQVRERVAGTKPFGLGLRLSNQAAMALAEPDQLERLRHFLQEHNLYVFTINGFPYGRFHGAPVKERVYAPDWRARERRDYTLRLADILAALLPEGVSGSISTVPGSYKEWITSDDDVAAMVGHMAAVVGHLVELRTRTGREIHLGLEPEPDCFIETTQEAVAFFRDAVPRWGCRDGVDETALRRHLGICFDTCHLLVQFEDPRTSLALLAQQGIRLSKIQVSAALRCGFNPESRTALGAFCDPVYLHQVRARDTAGNVARLGDLAKALESAAPDELREWRVHCHVPLYFEGGNVLQTTADALTPEFFAEAVTAGAEHFEIETYTFDVLPTALRGLGVVASIAREYEWVSKRLQP